MVRAVEKEKWELKIGMEMGMERVVCICLVRKITYYF